MGARHSVYFQDGPVFLLDVGADARILARYDYGAPAALVACFGAGRVAVTGPHSEASDGWCTDYGLLVHHTLDLARDLVERTARRLLCAWSVPQASCWSSRRSPVSRRPRRS
ncbi:hypothetical protein [Streptomyces roseochromogenus]|uniref:Uncharacterized protein n=1 Tax=Streptomyces roseochromogenus subsp. oscitans DS 12.976 TaxID=1352936 RepID=V6L643_STRRC|nr:hypothetical protein [Streptomyces roseochromogenus]EST36669.1 hypothetical protein M878_00815 [Streptomyces roseochromogenus subsp. oscitans DS 12.976]